MSMKTCSSAPTSSSTRLHKATRCSRSTDPSWRAWPKVNSRNKVPNVDGAYTPSNSVFTPPLRTTSMSSMLSAPAHMPATTVASFGAGLAAPDLIRGAAIQTFLSSRRPRPVCSANVITGTNPAHDTRWSSSNTAESDANLWDTLTGSAFLAPGDCLFENFDHPSSEGTFLVTPLDSASQSVDRG